MIKKGLYYNEKLNRTVELMSNRDYLNRFQPTWRWNLLLVRAKSSHYATTKRVRELLDGYEFIGAVK